MEAWVKIKEFNKQISHFGIGVAYKLETKCLLSGFVVVIDLKKYKFLRNNFFSKIHSHFTFISLHTLFANVAVATGC